MFYFYCFVLFQLKKKRSKPRLTPNIQEMRMTTWCSGMRFELSLRRSRVLEKVIIFPFEETCEIYRIIQSVTLNVNVLLTVACTLNSYLINYRRSFKRDYNLCPTRLHVSI